MSWPPPPLPVVSVSFTAVRVPSVVPIGVPVADTRWTSVRSTSVKVMLPLSVRLPAGVPCSVTAPTLILRGDDRGVVGAGDGDRDALGVAAGMTVIGGDRVGQRQGLAGGQVIERGCWPELNVQLTLTGVARRRRSAVAGKAEHAERMAFGQTAGRRR